MGGTPVRHKRVQIGFHLPQGSKQRHNQVEKDWPTIYGFNLTFSFIGSFGNISVKPVAPFTCELAIHPAGMGY